jgi:GNAT superfamily N-acetyltransferase
MALRHYTDAFCEQAVLSDGRRVLVRLVRPSDGPLLAGGFARLSPESRYRRFFSLRGDITAQEVEYLVNVDGERHFALGALDAGTGEGLGVARFIRFSPSDAEAAVTVVDDVQGKGLGTLLLQHLVRAACERGLRQFRFTVLASNEPMRQLIDRLSTECRVVRGGQVVEIDVPLPAAEPMPPGRAKEHPLYRLLVEAAAGVLVLARTTGGVRDWLLARKDGRAL